MNPRRKTSMLYGMHPHPDYLERHKEWTKSEMKPDGFVPKLESVDLSYDPPGRLPEAEGKFLAEPSAVRMDDGCVVWSGTGRGR